MKFESNIAFFGTRDDLSEFKQVAEKCLETIEETNNIRLIVIETWLFVDFSVRQLIMSALDLSKFNHEDYDLRYKLIPKNFSESLELLEKIKNTNEKLPVNKGSNLLSVSSNIQYRRVVEGWVESLVMIDEEWFKKARKINSTRNLAAHSYDQQKICAKLGFTGPDAQEKVKEECLNLIRQLLGCGSED